MTTVGVRELKNELSVYLARVEAGEVVTVTRRGKPIARLVSAGLPPRLQRLLKEGRLPGSGKRVALPERITLRGEGPTIYLDSSVLVELPVEEPGSSLVEASVRGTTAATSRLAYVETCSALASVRRSADHARGAAARARALRASLARAHLA
jgi:prevent-host-death family protein